VVQELLDKAGLTIPQERWYSNLRTRGNTGAASIFVMLDDFLRERQPRPGERILCFVPESGRFTVGYVLLEVAKNENRKVVSDLPAPPHDPANATSKPMQRLLRELAEVWHDYRSRAWRSPIIRRVARGALRLEDLVRWMGDWIPQVREGAFWMRKAVSHLDDRYSRVRELVTTHAGDEQFDFKILFDDYRAAGGAAANIEDLKRNAGGEALNSYLHARAAQANPVGLLGAIYIIEGTGQRIVPALLPEIRRQLKLPPQAVRFLQYHGENDQRHLARWLECVTLAIEAGGDKVADDIIATARNTAQLYLLQLEAVG
jgi:3-oxoacyl-[acyl-carrier-protein] synthase-3